MDVHFVACSITIGNLTENEDAPNYFYITLKCAYSCLHTFIIVLRIRSTCSLLLLCWRLIFLDSECEISRDLCVRGLVVCASGLLQLQLLVGNVRVLLNFVTQRDHAVGAKVANANLSIERD